jgi:hypothetical protein
MLAENYRDVVHLRQAALNDRPLLRQGGSASGGCLCPASRAGVFAHSQDRVHLKPATLVLIEQGCKDRWGIEFWVTEKVNRSIHAYKRDGSHIADHAGVLTGSKTHNLGQFRPRCPPVTGL